eukprot:COSAG02_NODE_263_length_26627_cov_47.198168_9_plen_64_part_00
MSSNSFYRSSSSSVASACCPCPCPCPCPRPLPVLVGFPDTRVCHTVLLEFRVFPIYSEACVLP